uniref:Uncharacterized protein n=1 Tax=Arundo donax TaxID=35708 RepID=A0A0A9F5B0_ARUDO
MGDLPPSSTRGFFGSGGHGAGAEE